MDLEQRLVDRLNDCRQDTAPYKTLDEAADDYVEAHVALIVELNSSRMGWIALHIMLVWSWFADRWPWRRKSIENIYIDRAWDRWSATIERMEDIVQDEAEKVRRVMRGEQP